jgi:DNA-binding PadR family transcriptional regulator
MILITPTEALLLGLLAHKHDGAFGSQLVHMSDGKLKRGSVYALLGKLEKAGFVSSVEDPATDELALPRTRYRITAEGSRARVEFAQWVGLKVPVFSVGAAA